jgi:molybdenum cofactor cytidylyltransferase
MKPNSSSCGVRRSCKRGQCRQEVCGKSSIRTRRARRLLAKNLTNLTRTRLLCDHGRVVRAVVLAAGASSRMGTPKAGLSLGDPADTFVSRLIRRLIEAGLPDIVVVTGAQPSAVRLAAGRIRPPVRFEHNDNWAEGQLTSLIAGLAERPGDVLEAVLVTLVDAPLVSVATIQRVLETWRACRAPIVRPARGDVHGHPVIFDRSLFEELRAADPQIGAKAVVRAHASAIVNVPVDDAGAFLDIDTPDEYQDALRQLRH